MSAQERKLAAVWAAGCSVLLGLQSVGALFPDERVWGFHLLHFVPGWLAAMTVALYLSAAAWPFLGIGVDRKGKKKTSAGNIPWSIIGIAVALAVASLAFKAAIPLLGNSPDILKNLGNTLKGHEFKAGVLYETQPLSAWAYLALTRMANSAFGAKPETVFLAVGAAASIPAVLGAWKLGSALFAERGLRFMTVALFLALPTTVLFFGYIEFYLLMYVCLLWYFIFAIKALKTGTSIWPALALLCLAAAFHVTALLLLPSALLLVYRRLGGKDVAVRVAWVAVLAVAVAGAAWYFLSDQHVGRGFFVPLQETADGVSYTLFSPARILDIANLLLLYLPAPLLLCLLCFAAPGAREGEGSVSAFGVIAFAFPLLFLASWNSLLGMARDWDVASFAGLSITVACAIFIGTRPALRSILARWALPVSALAAATVLPWIGTIASSTASIDRFQQLLALNAPLVDRQGTLTGLETIRVMSEAVRNHRKELETAVEMLKYSRDPFEVSKLMMALRRAGGIPDPEKYVGIGALRLREILELSARGALRESEGEAVRRNFSRAVTECLNWYYDHYQRDAARSLAARLKTDLPGQSHGYTAAAYCALKDLKAEAAIAECLEAEKRGAPDQVTFTTKGIAEMNLGRLDDANRSLLRSRKIDPELSITTYTLAMLSLRGYRDTAQAIDYLTQYTSQEPGNRKARAMLEALTLSSRPKGGIP